MASQTRQKLVEAATERFYREGFRNVGLDQILADVGISKTAFYKHFACKEDLMLAALDDKDRWLQSEFRSFVAGQGGTPAEQLARLFDIVERIIAHDEFHGCIFVNVAMEFPQDHDPVHVAAARNKRAIEEIVFEVAQAAGAADPRQLARELCLLMEGAYVTRQVTGSRDAVNIARRIAGRLIADSLPTAATAESNSR